MTRPIRTQRILADLDAMLAETLQRYGRAVTRLRDEIGPGFPTRTPASGDPGGGRGPVPATRTTDPADDSVPDDDPVEGTSTERAALNRHPELDGLDELLALPDELQEQTEHLLADVGVATSAIAPPFALAPLRRIAWCQWALRQLRASDVLVERCPAAQLDHVERKAHRLWTLTRRWGYQPRRPTDKPADPDLLAVDDTGRRCRSCLRVGVLADRWRGELCKWCDEFRRGEGFLPPGEVLEARAAGWRVTEAMVRPWRERHQARTAHAGRKSLRARMRDRLHAGR